MVVPTSVSFCRSKSSGGRNFSPEQAAGAIADRLMRAADKVRSRKKGYVLALYESSQQAVLEAQTLTEDVKLWHAFIDLPFWQEMKGGRPSDDDQEKALHYTMRMACGGNSNTASDRRLAVQQLLDVGIEPSAIATELERRGGFKGVLRTHSKPGKAAKDSDEKTKSAAKRSSAHKTAVIRSRPLLFDPKRHLAVDMSEFRAVLRQIHGNAFEGCNMFIQRIKRADGGWDFKATFAQMIG